MALKGLDEAIVRCFVDQGEEGVVVAIHIQKTHLSETFSSSYIRCVGCIYFWWVFMFCVEMLAGLNKKFLALACLGGISLPQDMSST